MRILFFSPVLFFIFCAGETFGQKQAEKNTARGVYQIEQWKPAEITLASTKKYDRPFEQADVTATFTSPGNDSIVRPAFWNGGDSWVVRFAAPAPGQWKMTTTCSDKSNRGLNNVSGTVMCKPYTGNLDIYKHGFLKISANKRYFEYADGTPFFYLGDTHWIYIHERFDTSNVKGVPSQFKYIVDKRVQQGFTVYQSEAIQHPHGQKSAGGGGDHSGKDEESFCNFRDGFDEKDLAGFKNIDRKFAYVAAQGLVNANSAVCWALDPAKFPDVYSDAFMYKLGRYWAARYGAYPVFWTVAQEVDKNMYHNFDSVTINKWFAVGKALHENDGYHHPLTAHMENVASTKSGDSWWGDKSFHSWWSVQWQADLNPDIMPIGKNFWNSTITKPSVIYESAYEGFWTDAKGARETGYKAFQNGMYGYGYGANGVWNDLYAVNPPDYGTDYEMPARFVSWYDGANLTAATQLIHLKFFYKSIEWWKLVPRFDDNMWSAFSDRKDCFLATDEQKTFVVYFANKVLATGALKNLATNKTYSAKWYNTKSGVYTELTPFTTNNGTWTIPAKPDSDDWLLLVEQL